MKYERKCKGDIVLKIVRTSRIFLVGAKKKKKKLRMGNRAM